MSEIQQESAENPAAEILSADNGAEDTNSSVDTSEGLEQQVQILSDEDYRLNFLGTDKFELSRETPEEIRSALKTLEKSLNKGWTEKNMKLAEERRQVFAAQQQAALEAQTYQASLKEMAKLEALQDQIKAYDEVNWSGWIQQDPESANKALLSLQTLERSRKQLEDQISTRNRESQSNQLRQLQTWLSQSEERVSSRIRDWGESKQKELGKFLAESYLNTNTPMDQGAYQAISMHPGLVELAHDAMLYRRSLEKASKDSKPASPAPTVIQKVGGAAQATKDPNKMTDAEWSEMKRKQKESALQSLLARRRS